MCCIRSWRRRRCGVEGADKGRIRQRRRVGSRRMLEPAAKEASAECSRPRKPRPQCIAGHRRAMKWHTGVVLDVGGGDSRAAAPVATSASGGRLVAKAQPDTKLVPWRPTTRNDAVGTQLDHAASSASTVVSSASSTPAASTQSRLRKLEAPDVLFVPDINVLAIRWPMPESQEKCNPQSRFWVTHWELVWSVDGSPWESSAEAQRVQSLGALKRLGKGGKEYRFKYRAHRKAGVPA